VSQRAVGTRSSRHELMQKTDTWKGRIHKSYIQHSDAIPHFTHVSVDSTKLTKAETSSESTPSAILK
jgi:hypothetical protein